MSNILQFPPTSRMAVHETLEEFAQDEPINNVLILSDMSAQQDGLVKMSWANMTGEEALALLDEAREAILCGAFITLRIEAE